METQQSIEIINRIAEIIGLSSSQIIKEYASWFFIKSIFMVTIFTAAAFFIFKWNIYDANGVCKYDGFGIFMKFIGIIICTIVVSYHIPNCASPKAIAINQLLLDLKR